MAKTQAPPPDDLGKTMRAVDLGQVHASDESPITPEALNRYSVRGERGRGGMGRVLIAYDEHVGREIAIKELLDPLDATAASYFLHEARITGQLEHPNIVPVYEVGRSAGGSLYYTMRLVRGRNLTAELAECRSLKDRLHHLGSFWDLSKAVSYMHSRGVLHRDLKPDNVMVGEFGETVLLDLGLAKIQPACPTPRLPTEAPGPAIGTPAYMSPEQAQGRPEDIDERSDVWGLGAVLYEILTGRPPFEGSTVSATLVMVTSTPLVPVREVSPDAPAELAAIAEKALQKDCASRYQSAREMTAEINAFMTGGRVRAHAYTSWELIRRFAVQNKLTFAFASVALMAVIAALVAVSIFYGRERAAHLASELSLADAYQERAAKFFADFDLGQTRHYAASSLLHNPAHPLGQSYDEEFARAHPEARRLRVQAASMLLQTRLREVAHLERSLTASGALAGVAFSADGARLVSGASSYGEAFVWDLPSGTLLRSIELPRASATVLALTRDGALLACSGMGRPIQLYNPATGELVREIEGTTVGAMQLAFSPDGTLLASANRDHTATLWDVATGQPRVVLERHTGIVEAVAFSLDGHTLATGSSDRTVLVWSVPDGTLLGRTEPGAGPILAVAFAPDGKTLAVGGSERIVRLLSVPDAQAVRTFTGHHDSVLGLAWSADGKLLVSLGEDGTRIWDAGTGATLSIMGNETGTAERGAALSTDGQWLALSGDDHAVHLYRLGRDPTWAAITGHDKPVNDVSFSVDGARLITSSSDRTTRIWDVATQRELATLSGHYGPVLRHALSPDGTHLATCSDHTLRLWDLSTGQVVKQLDVGDGNSAVAFSPDGGLLASGGRDAAVRLRDAATGEVLASLAGHEGAVVRLSFSPDGKHLASASKDKTVRIWDVAARKLERTIAAHADWAWSVAYSPDGASLASAGKDGQVVLWDPATGKAIRSFAGHDGKWVNEVAYSRDGKVLATGGDDKTVRLWEASSGEELLVLRANAAAGALALSPDGKTLAIAISDTVEIYPADFAAVLAVDPRPLLGSGLVGGR